MSLDPRQPVIVGVAQTTQKPDDLATAVEAVALMTQTVEAAAADAGNTDLLHKLDAVGVVNGAWSYSDPGRLIAETVGSPEAITMLSHHGGNTPQSFMNAMCKRIADGELDVAAITGAETIWSRRRRKAAGLPSNITQQSDVEPDERFASSFKMSSEFEAERGFEMPINYYPVFESAIRANRGESIEDHRTRISELWEGFNRVALDNPYAWSKNPMTSEEIREATPKNRMVGFPYTKALNSNWDLDQGASIIVCSVAAAESAGIPRDRWVFPHAGTDAHDTVFVSNRRDLHTSPAIEFAGAKLFAMTGTSPDDFAHLDIYSCFTSAVQIACAELGIDLDRTLTVTGGLPFAGGPLNNYVSHSIATMVDVLRDDAGSLGLVTANGGYITKHALGVYSTQPPSHLFAHANVQDKVDAAGHTEVDTAFAGAANIEGYTVMHSHEGPEKTIAALRTPDGARTFAQTKNLDVAAEVMADEAVGREAVVSGDGELTLAG